MDPLAVAARRVGGRFAGRADHARVGHEEQEQSEQPLSSELNNEDDEGATGSEGPAPTYSGGIADKEFYQDLLDQISDGVYFVTLDGRITYWNGGAERISGYGANEVLGHSCGEGILRHVDGAGRQLCLKGCPLLGVMQDGKPREAHVYLHHKDGQRVPVTVRGPSPAGPGRRDRRLRRGLFDPGGLIPMRASAAPARTTRSTP